MALVLHVQSLDADIPLALPRDGWVETDRDLTIGRGPENDLVLVDPAGTISKRHCAIRCEEGSYAIVDVSRNGTFLNRAAQPMERDRPVTLRAGDFIQVGYFGIAVVAINAPGEGAEADASFLGAVAPHRAPSASAALAASEGLISRPEEPLVIEGDDDGYALPDWAEPDERPALSVSAHADHVSVPDMAFVQPRMGQEAIPDDWDLMSDLGLAQTPQAPTAAPQPAVPRPAAPTTVIPGDGAAIAAFLEGCGLPAEACGQIDLVTLMGRAGRTLRSAVGNLHDVLRARSSTKEGLGVERTMLGRSGNNPLKFVPDHQSALMAVLVSTIPGFLDADEAIAEGFADIKDHQIAMVQAMQAALASVCLQLAPETVESDIGPPSALERVMPQRRAARRWNAYCATFADVTTALDNNARQIFGEEFTRAYQRNHAAERGDGDVE